MPKSLASWLSLIAFAVVVVIIGIYLAAGAAALPSVEMSRHGWIALGLGTVVSVLVGGALTAVLVISRRRGFDEAAHNVQEEVLGGDD